ncbi:MAG TPA: rod shape-determining protein MreC [Thermoanaerobaculia bacterium]|nr:rod shape-determining protein MreC [Thermoanaerobaculia bacterium]
MKESHAVWLLALVLVAQLLLLAVQVRGEGGKNLLERGMLRVVAPMPRLVSWFSGSVEELGEGFRSRDQLELESRTLRGRLEELELELFRLRNVEEERDRLAAALDYTPQVPGRLRPVEVIYLDHSSWLRTLILHLGEQPARVDQPVVTPEGLVGRVVEVSGPYAKVQLLTDRAAAASAVIARTRRQALVRGGSDLLELDFVPLQASVLPGDRVLTAGTDGIYPRGILIGTVVEVGDSGELFREVAVAPAVDFAFLDRVYLLERGRIPDGLIEGDGRGGR